MSSQSGENEGKRTEEYLTLEELQRYLKEQKGWNYSLIMLRTYVREGRFPGAFNDRPENPKRGVWHVPISAVAQFYPERRGRPSRTRFTPGESAEKLELLTSESEPLTLLEAVMYLKERKGIICSEYTLRTSAVEGKLTGAYQNKPGGSWYIPIAALDSFTLPKQGRPKSK